MPLVTTNGRSEWDPQYDADGNVYYYNIISGETRWSLDEAETCVWEEYKDESGNVYYQNNVTGNKTYELPEVSLVSLSFLMDDFHQDTHHSKIHITYY